MRATVLETKENRSVILTEDGEFRTVQGCYPVGSEFDYRIPLRQNRKLTSRIAAVAAALFMMLSMGTYSYQNLMVYATVTLQGTTPIQLELNRKDKVIGVKAVDEKGEALAEKLLDDGIKGEGVENAVAKAERIMTARDGKNHSASAKAPKVKCKNSDRAKEIADKVRIGQQKAGEADPAAGTPTETSTQAGSQAAGQTGTQAPTQGTTSVTTEDRPAAATQGQGDNKTGEKTDGKSGDKTDDPKTGTPTQQFSDESMSPQDEPEGLTPQEGGETITPQSDESEPAMQANEAAEDAAPEAEPEEAGSAE